jgi:hypothetical protein
MRRTRRTSIRWQGAALAVLMMATALVSCSLADLENLLNPSEPLRWLALGDSYSSGEGTGNALDAEGANKCQRSGQAYGPAAAAILGQNVAPSTVEVTHLACTGAFLEQYDNKDRLDPSDWRLTDKDSTRQLARVQPGSTYDVITASFGGNNVGFASVIMHCLGYSVVSDSLGPFGGGLLDLYLVNSGHGFCSLDKKGVQAAIRALRPKLALFYMNMVDRLSLDGYAYVVGYPHLFGDPEQWSLWNTALTCSGIKADDAAVINSLVDTMNRTIHDAVNDAKKALRTDKRRISYFPIDKHYAGHEVCGTEEPWINPIPTLDLNESRGLLGQFSPSMHPNAQGHAAVAAQLAFRVIEDFPSVANR